MHMSKITRMLYLHSSKDGMYEEFENILKGEALENIMYGLYEVGFKVEVDTKTGKYRILKVIDEDQVLVPQQ